MTESATWKLPVMNLSDVSNVFQQEAKYFSLTLSLSRGPWLSAGRRKKLYRSVVWFHFCFLPYLVLSMYLH